MLATMAVGRMDSSEANAGRQGFRCLTIGIYSGVEMTVQEGRVMIWWMHSVYRQESIICLWAMLIQLRRKVDLFYFLHFKANCKPFLPKIFAFYSKAQTLWLKLFIQASNEYKGVTFLYSDVTSILIPWTWNKQQMTMNQLRLSSRLHKNKVPLKNEQLQNIRLGNSII